MMFFVICGRGSIYLFGIGSYSNSWSSVKPIRAYYFNGKISGLDNLITNSCYMRKKHGKRILHVENSKFSPSWRFLDFRKHSSIFHKLRRMDCLLPFASADGVTVNGSCQARTSDDVEEMRYKLNQSSQDEDHSTGLVQLLHDSARIFELAIKEQSSLSKLSWFSATWLGVDKNTWAKVMSYQESVYSLLHSANEISSRGDGRDRDINVFVQRSLSRQSAPLENVIREELLAKQAAGFDWFWSEQVPNVVTSFVCYFEKDKRFAAATAVQVWYRKDLSSDSGNSSDISLLMLSLSCFAAIAKLGSTRVSCAQLFSVSPDISGRFMDMLVEFVPACQAYYSIKEIGLHREFLVHFGP